MGMYVARAPLQVLVSIDTFIKEQGWFPSASDLCKEKKSQRGALIRSYSILEQAGFIARRRHDWESGSITEAGQNYLVHGEVLGTVKGAVSAKELAQFKLAPREEAALYHIRHHFYVKGTFPSPNDIVAVVHGRVTNRNRGHMNKVFNKLEQGGFIAREGSHHWDKGGRFTDVGLAFANTLTEPRLRRTIKKTGGGLAPDGGTRFPDMLFSATEGKIIQPGDKHSKLGLVVSRAAGKRLQMGLPIATFSLEEGRTCSPDCGLRDRCYAGKMTAQRRIRYEGLVTDRAVMKAISDEGPAHYRINTVGDFPNLTFFQAVLTAVTVTRSTAFGYSHWPLETELGADIRDYADAYWDFFSIRTSYEHGSRPPLKRRAAVVLPSFDPELLALHNAVPCPENLQRFGGVKFKRDVNCGNCGLCWTLEDANVAFVEH